MAAGGGGGDGERGRGQGTVPLDTPLYKTLLPLVLCCPPSVFVSLTQCLSLLSTICLCLSQTVPFLVDQLANLTESFEKQRKELDQASEAERVRAGTACTEN